MSSSKLFLVMFVVAACLAGLVLSASVAQNEEQREQSGGLCKMLCEVCKQVAEQVKAGIPQAEAQLKGMCKNCGAQENVEKCEKAIDEMIKNIESKSPEQICQMAGFCKKSQFLSMVGL